MGTSGSLVDWTAFLPALHDALANATGPMTASQLRSALPGGKKPPKADIEALLEAQVRDGQLHRWIPTAGKTPRYWSQSPESVVQPLLLELLTRADEPMSAADCRRRSNVDVSLSLIERLLEDLVAAGNCQRYEPLRGKSPRYWAGDPEQYARRVMLGILERGKGKSHGPLSWTELAKAVTVPLKGMSENRLSEILQDLLDAGAAFKALTLTPGKADRYTTRAPDLVALMRESFADLYAKYARVGISTAAVNQAAMAALGLTPAPAASDLAGAVQSTFSELKRERYGHTGLVPIPDVRRRIAASLGPDAARHDVLDGVIKQLVTDGKLNIIPLNDSVGISAEERNEAIPGTHETWFYLESRP